MAPLGLILYPKRISFNTTHDQFDIEPITVTWKIFYGKLYRFPTKPAW